MHGETAVIEAQKALSVEFKDSNLLRTALTHSSFAYEIKSAEFNEKLEFLGDSVLGLAVTDYIFNTFPEMQEGGLAKLRANVVKADTLSERAFALGLGKYIFMGRGAEQSGGRENESILADCLEAVIGAIYIDRGYEYSRDMIIGLFKNKIHEQAGQKVLGDPKTILQELTMDRWSTLPDYEIFAQDGPAHSPMFSAQVLVKGQVYGRGVGRSKKRAEQLAAKEALKELSKLEF